jgi:hypothetical protein
MLAKSVLFGTDIEDVNTRTASNDRLYGQLMQANAMRRTLYWSSEMKASQVSHHVPNASTLG